jgi:hypothetical protein
VRAARGDRDEGLLRLPGRVVHLVVPLADVDGGLARVADLGVDVHHPLHVGVRAEVALRAEVLPAVGDGLLEQRAEREAKPGQRERHGGDAARGERGALHETAARDGLALERARDPATLRVAGLLVELLR